MQIKKIIVSVSNDLTNDQRVHRICNSLQNNGYNVLLIGRRLNSSSRIDQRVYKTLRFKLLFNKGILFYACLNIRFFLFLLFQKTDILLSNDLDTLLCNTLISKIKKTKLIYDSHELFTEVPELQNSKLKKKIWLKIEQYCITKTNKSYTVSSPIANFYCNKYNIDMKLVRNLPVKKEISIEYKNRDNILIYQGTLNTERGIEILIESLLFLPEFSLIIAGKGYLKDELKKLVNKYNLESRVLFTGNLDFDSLNKITNKAKIGFSIEQGTSLNYHYALPNKIFDYIQAGVPVICSNFPEMKNIIDSYNVGEIFYSNKAEDLAKQITNLVNNTKLLNEYQLNCLKSKDFLNWENEEKILLDIFKSV